VKGYRIKISKCGRLFFNLRQFIIVNKLFLTLFQQYLFLLQGPFRFLKNKTSSTFHNIQALLVTFQGLEK